MPDEWLKQIVITMASPPPLRRRRIVGLPDPRSARAQANDTEFYHRSMQLILQSANLTWTILIQAALVILTKVELLTISSIFAPHLHHHKGDNHQMSLLLFQSSARRHQETGIIGLATMQS